MYFHAFKGKEHNGIIKADLAYNPAGENQIWLPLQNAYALLKWELPLLGKQSADIYYLGVKGMFFWDTKSILAVRSTLLTSKGPKSHGGRQFWLKHCAHFHINHSSILDIALNFKNKQFAAKINLCMSN